MAKAKRRGMPESIRKKLVSLKRKPQTIPLLVLAFGFLFYSLNLTNISNTTARINIPGMGLSGFCTMLFSLLSFVCFLNSFPHRKKANVPMLVLLVIMLGVLMFCDAYYASRIVVGTTREASPIEMTDYIAAAASVVRVHFIVTGLGLILTLLVPVLRKLLRKIDTSVAEDDAAQMSNLVLSDDA